MVKYPLIKYRLSGRIEEKRYLSKQNFDLAGKQIISYVSSLTVEDHSREMILLP